jgi:hypothetical protein
MKCGYAPKGGKYTEKHTERWTATALRCDCGLTCSWRAQTASSWNRSSKASAAPGPTTTTPRRRRKRTRACGRSRNIPATCAASAAGSSIRAGSAACSGVWGGVKDEGQDVTCLRCAQCAAVFLGQFQHAFAAPLFRQLLNRPPARPPARTPANQQPIRTWSSYATRPKNLRQSACSIRRRWPGRAARAVAAAGCALRMHLPVCSHVNNVAPRVQTCSSRCEVGGAHQTMAGGQIAGWCPQSPWRIHIPVDSLRLWSGHTCGCGWSGEPRSAAGTGQSPWLPHPPAAARAGPAAPTAELGRMPSQSQCRKPSRTVRFPGAADGPSKQWTMDATGAVWSAVAARDCSERVRGSG